MDKSPKKKSPFVIPKGCTCREKAVLLINYLIGELSLRQASAYEHHRLNCVVCNSLVEKVSQRLSQGMDTAKIKEVVARIARDF